MGRMEGLMSNIAGNSGPGFGTIVGIGTVALGAALLYKYDFDLQKIFAAAGKGVGSGTVGAVEEVSKSAYKDVVKPGAVETYRKVLKPAYSKVLKPTYTKAIKPAAEGFYRKVLKPVGTGAVFKKPIDSVKKAFSKDSIKKGIKNIFHL